LATADFLAYVLTSKFVAALPFYRQGKQFDRLGIEPSRRTICGWAIKAAESCVPYIRSAGNKGVMVTGKVVQFEFTFASGNWVADNTRFGLRREGP
jgi:transposase